MAPSDIFTARRCRRMESAASVFYDSLFVYIRQ